MKDKKEKRTGNPKRSTESSTGNGDVGFGTQTGLKPRATVNKIPAKEGMKSNTNNLTTQFFIIQY